MRGHSGNVILNVLKLAIRMTKLENFEAGVTLCCRVPKECEAAGLAHFSKFQLIFLHNLS